MKLFNAQSAKIKLKVPEITEDTKDTLDNKVVMSEDLLASIAGGINETYYPWPPVRPK